MEVDHNKALYALCVNDNLEKIKIGKISGNLTTLSNQYSTRYNPDGYKILRYWSGSNYYSIENKVHTSALLAPCRIRNKKTGRLTEWFSTTLDVIDFVVSALITEENRLPFNLKVIELERHENTQNQQGNNDENETLKNYAADTFVYADFIQDLCSLGTDKKMPTADLYKIYVDYTGIKADSDKTFTKLMEKRFPKARKGTGGRYHYMGIDIDIAKVNEFNSKRSESLCDGYDEKGYPTPNKIKEIHRNQDIVYGQPTTLTDQVKLGTTVRPAKYITMAVTTPKRIQAQALHPIINQPQGTILI